MSLSLLVRSPVIRQQGPAKVLARARSLHTTTPVRSAHGDYHHLPFKWPGEKKTAFMVKLLLYFGIGGAIPIATTTYQLKKSGGST